jgi:hypothetical protein
LGNTNRLSWKRQEGDAMHPVKWEQPNPADLQVAEEPPVPDTESLLAEVGSSYPAVSYPAAQTEDTEQESAVEQTIFAGLVWP